jgi:CubicO group peptidase (beta-lactamase class C family)
MIRCFAILLGLLVVTQAQAEALPVTVPDGPDAEAYGQSQGYPPAAPRGKTSDQSVIVGSYSQYGDVYAGSTAAASPDPEPFRRATEEISLTYQIRGKTRTLTDYLASNPTTGLLIARNDTILFEHYQYDRIPAHQFMSQSMSKTVVGLLVGSAIADGSIRSVDDVTETYVPEWKGTELGKTPIRALLHMASGLAFTEIYDGNDDEAALSRALLGNSGSSPEADVARFDKRVAPAGTLFHYAGRDTEALALVLAHATGQNLAKLLEQRLWQPMGAEAPANWTNDYTGQQIAYCCLSATLRDWARLGLLVANDGTARGRRVIPAEWIRDTTSYEPNSPFAPTADLKRWGYGYQIWLLLGARQSVAFVGVRGQRVYVDRASKLVLVHTAVRTARTGDAGDSELTALWRALVAQGKD